MQNIESKCNGTIMAIDPATRLMSGSWPISVVPDIPDKIVESPIDNNTIYVPGMKKKILNRPVFILAFAGIFCWRPMPIDQNQPKSVAVTMTIKIAKKEKKYGMFRTAGCSVLPKLAKTDPIIKN